MKELLIKVVDKWPGLFSAFRSRRFSALLGRYHSFEHIQRDAGITPIPHYIWFDMCTIEVEIGASTGALIVLCFDRGAKIVGATFNKCSFVDISATGNVKCAYKQDGNSDFKFKNAEVNDEV